LRIASEGIDTWNGFKVRHGAVAYLAGEGHAGLRARCKAWLQEHHVDGSNVPFYISQSGTDLNTPEGLQKTITSLNDMHILPRLIVVDTLNRFLDGDENSAQDTKTMLDACGELTREFECTVILVHHTGVSGEAQKRGRGSSAWKGALEQEIMVEKAENTPNIKLIQTKNKDSEPAKPVGLELASVTLKGWFDEDGEPVKSAIVIQREIQDTPKVNPKVEDNLKTIQRAWFSVDCPEMDGKPYITRSALKQKLISDRLFNSATTLDNQLRPSRKNGLISVLLDAKELSECADGWVVDKVERAGQWMIEKGMK